MSRIWPHARRFAFGFGCVVLGFAVGRQRCAEDLRVANEAVAELYALSLHTLAVARNLGRAHLERAMPLALVGE